MNKIPFDLKKYRTGKYDVITRLGHNIRILCTDLRSNFPIAVAFMHDTEADEVLMFNACGRLNMEREQESGKDLMLIKKTIIVNGIKVPHPECESPIKGKNIIFQLSQNLLCFMTFLCGKIQIVIKYYLNAI